ncbi:hypothetical protein UlMin_045754 [Ulmus minor]
MQNFLCSLDDDVWFSILEGYKIPAEVTEEGSVQKPLSKWTIQEKRDSNMNSKALNALFCGVDDLNFRDITNRSCLLGEEYVESKIVRKILRSLPHRFQGKVIAIEESKNVDKIRLEELIGSLETFEMGLGEEKKEKNKNIAFKSENNSKNNEAIDNEELVFFTRKECVNNKGKSMKVTWSDDSDEESEEGETEEENIQSFTTKLEEFEEESIEENDDYEESLEHCYQELFDQGLELIKEKKRLKGNITILEISNNNLIDVIGSLKEEKQKLSSEGIELQQKLDGAYKELKEKIHELAIEIAKKHELKESLKETQHDVSVLTLGAEKVTKMINFGKINNDKKGLGFDEDKVYSNSSTIFVKATSSPLNSGIDSQTKIVQSNKKANNIPKEVSRPSVSKNLHLKKNLSKKSSSQD